jgi:hypothetical protein
VSQRSPKVMRRKRSAWSDHHVLHPCHGPQGLTHVKRDPFVRFRLRDTPATRAIWDHSFELHYTVTLGAKQLGLRLTARNTGSKEFELSAGLNTHVGVSDALSNGVMLLVRPPQSPVFLLGKHQHVQLTNARLLTQGLQGVHYVDKLEAPASRAQSERPTWPSPALRIECVQSQRLHLPTIATRRS